MAAPVLRTRPRPSCTLCGSGADVVYSNLHDAYYGVSGTWQMNQCVEPKCRLLWLDPSPDPDDLHLAYQSYFTHAHSRPNLRGWLFRVYKAATKAPAAAVGLLAEQHALHSMFLDGVQPGCLLDVGCGDGTFLHSMKSKGWTLHGVDFDAAAIQNAKVKFGLDLHIGSLQTAGFRANTFDAITMSHVIEHVPDPQELVTEAKRVMKPGGRLVITTPNALSLGHRIYGHFWFGLDAPRHLQLFNPTNLGKLLQQSHFRLLRIGSTAARADVFFGASEHLRVTNGSATHSPGLNFLRALRAVAFQLREHRQMDQDASCGEEVFAVATSL